MSGPSAPFGSARRLARVVVASAALLHLLALVACILALRFVGEAWWPTTVLLYVPRLYLALPLPFLVLALSIGGPRWLLASPLVAAGLLLLPLGGFRWTWPELDPGAPTLRILSYNAAFGRSESEAVCREVDANGPDIVVLQAYSPTLAVALEHCLFDYERVVDGEFLLATRFPIVYSWKPPRLASGHRAGFVAYTLDAPLGPIDLFSVHPISPRDGFEALEDAGGQESEPLPLYERIFSADAQEHVRENTALRRAQVEALAAAIRAARHPVIVAGDTNLPVLSRLFAEELGGLQDGFERAGRGLGYTFPSERPWMRIDRVLAGPALRFTRFRVGDRSQTTHFCVVADLQRRERWTE